MRIQNIFHLAALLLLATCSLPLTAAEQSVQSRVAKHCLWKVDGGRSTVYLLGSVHLMSKENYPLPSPIEAAFSNSQIAVFEADMDEMRSPETQTKMMSRAQLPAGESLRKLLSASTYAAFTNYVAKSGLPPTAFDTYKPLIGLSVLEMGELQKLGFEPQFGLDEHFAALAHKQGKEIASLETVDFQIDLVTGLANEDSESIVKAELKEIENVKRDFAQIIAGWETGDAQSLEKLLLEAMKESPALYKRLLTERNQRWAPKIEEWARGNKSTIIIVGAGHLVGEGGVVQLLSRKGFKVRQE